MAEEQKQDEKTGQELEAVKQSIEGKEEKVERLEGGLQVWRLMPLWQVLLHEGIAGVQRGENGLSTG